MATHILDRRDTAANWTAANPVLFPGEEGYETDTGNYKKGDGVTPWNTLDYKGGGGGVTPDATAAVKGKLRIGGDFGGTADNPTVTGGTNHTHTVEQVSNASVTGKALMLTASATTARDTLGVGEKSKQEAHVLHDGTAGGGIRPTGYFRVIWVGGAARPTNMLTNIDIWEP